ncbi:hypothetical protein BS17DRAFT_719971, partial [Gyrodon lividus]
NLHLCLAPNILAKVLSKTTASSIGSSLKEEYGAPGIATTYTEFKAMLDMPIPSHEHPAPAFSKINAHFMQLAEVDFEISPKVQAMILLAKLPSSMDTITHLISQEARILTSTLIEKSATLAWEQCGTTTASPRRLRSLAL